MHIAKNIACNQVLYHMKERAIEATVIPWCRERGIPVMAYSPLGQGKFPRHDVLNQVAAKHKATPAQVALAFLTRDPVVFAIPKTSQPDRAVENVKAMDVRLSAEDVAALDQAFPVKLRSELPMI